VLRARDAVEGRPAQLPGGAHRALDARLDDVVSGERIPPALRTLLARVGDALDLAYPIDLGAMSASPVAGDHPLASAVQTYARALELPPIQVLATPRLGRVAVPCGSAPPILLVGTELLGDVDPAARAFVLFRALKLVVARSSALVRAQAQGVASMLAGLFVALNPHYVPEGIAKAAWLDASQRIAPSLPRQADPTVAVLALEAAGTLGPNLSNVGPSVLAWADRAALLALADLNAAFDAIAWSVGEPQAPREPEARAAWVARTSEARELVVYAVGEEWLEARRRLGLGA
jgi:hypothetical protein